MVVSVGLEVVPTSVYEVAEEINCGAAEDKDIKNCPVIENTHNVTKDEKIAGTTVEDKTKGEA